MPLSFFKELNLGEVTNTNMTLQLVDHSMKKPYGVVEDVLVKVDKFVFLVDFVILDFDQDKNYPMIMGRPFLNTGRALIDIYEGNITLRVRDEKVEFTMSKLMRQPLEIERLCMRVEEVDECVREIQVEMELENQVEDDHLEEEA